MSSTQTSLLHTLVDHARAEPTRPALRFKRRGLWHIWDRQTLLERIVMAASGLSQAGVDAGDRVAVQSRNRPEWVVLDLAVQLCGATSVGIDPMVSRSETVELLERARVGHLVAEDQEQVDKALSLDLPALEHIYVLNPRGLRNCIDTRLHDAAEILEADAGDDVQLDRWLATLRPDGECTLLISQGRTGVRKSVRTTHRNLMSAVDASRGELGYTASDEFFPLTGLSQASERTLTLYGAIAVGACISFPESESTIVENLVEISPTVLVADSWVWDAFAERIRVGVAAASRLKRSQGSYWIRRCESVDTESSWLWESLGRLVFHEPVKRRLGLNRVRIALMTGSAPLESTLCLLLGMGLSTRQAYGAVETCGISHLQSNAHQQGNVGSSARVLLPLNGFEQSITAAGELRVRGRSVGEVGVGSWFETGDLVEEESGGIRLTGSVRRVSDEHGAEIERVIQLEPLIDAALVTIDNDDCLQVLVVVEPAATKDWALSRGIDFEDDRQLFIHTDVRLEVRDAVSRSLGSISKAHRQCSVQVIPRPLSLFDDELTHSRQLRHHNVRAAFIHLFDESS